MVLFRVKINSFYKDIYPEVENYVEGNLIKVDDHWAIQKADCIWIDGNIDSSVFKCNNWYFIGETTVEVTFDGINWKQVEL